MPNWCVGTMKVRGTSENLTRFFKEGVFHYDDKKPLTFIYDKGENKADILSYVKTKDSGYLAIKGVTRNEISPLNDYGEIYFTGSRNDENIRIGYFRFETAWGIETDQLVEVSKEYGIDIRIHAFEQGMEFEQFIEVHAGNLVKNEVISFEDRDWAWESVNPNWGG